MNLVPRIDHDEVHKVLDLGDDRIQNEYFHESLCNKPQVKIRTFDNRIQENKDVYIEGQFMPHNFDFETYQFAGAEAHFEDYRLDQYRKHFVFAKNNKINKKKMYGLMLEIIDDQVNKTLEANLKNQPATLKGNRQIWKQLLIKSHKIQHFCTDFSQRLENILTTEIIGNSENL